MEQQWKRQNLEGDHVSLPDGGFECIGPMLEPLKLIHLVKIYGIYQANKILILDALNAFWPLDLNLKHQSFLLLDQRVNFTFKQVIPIVLRSG